MRSDKFVGLIMPLVLCICIPATAQTGGQPDDEYDVVVMPDGSDDAQGGGGEQDNPDAPMAYGETTLSPDDEYDRPNAGGWIFSNGMVQNELQEGEFQDGNQIRNANGQVIDIDRNPMYPDGEPMDIDRGAGNEDDRSEAGDGLLPDEQLPSDGDVESNGAASDEYDVVVMPDGPDAAQGGGVEQDNPDAPTAYGETTLSPDAEDDRSEAGDVLLPDDQLPSDGDVESNGAASDEYDVVGDALGEGEVAPR